MTWKYEAIPMRIFDEKVIRVVEKFKNGSFIELKENDWIFEDIDEAISTFKMILKDLESQKVK